MEKQLIAATLPEFIQALTGELRAILEQQLSILSHHQQPKESEWMTRKEVARYLKVSLATLHAYQKQGLIAPHRIDGVKAPYYNRSEIEKLFKAKKTLNHAL